MPIHFGIELPLKAIIIPDTNRANTSSISAFVGHSFDAKSFHAILYLLSQKQFNTVGGFRH